MFNKFSFMFYISMIIDWLQNELTDWRTVVMVGHHIELIKNYIKLEPY